MECSLVDSRGGAFLKRICWVGYRIIFFHSWLWSDIGATFFWSPGGPLRLLFGVLALFDLLHDHGELPDSVDDV